MIKHWSKQLGRKKYSLLSREADVGTWVQNWSTNHGAALLTNLLLTLVCLVTFPVQPWADHLLRDRHHHSCLVSLTSRKQLRKCLTTMATPNFDGHNSSVVVSSCHMTLDVKLTSKANCDSLLAKYKGKPWDILPSPQRQGPWFNSILQMSKFKELCHLTWFRSSSCFEKFWISWVRSHYYGLDLKTTPMGACWKLGHLQMVQ